MGAPKIARKKINRSSRSLRAGRPANCAQGTQPILGEIPLAGYGRDSISEDFCVDFAVCAASAACATLIIGS
jgi:hypothetical protein